MQAIIQEIAELHAAEASVLWSLPDRDADLDQRISAQLRGLRVCRARGADPLAGLVQPWSGADLFPAAWLGDPRAVAGDGDDDGRRAIADAANWR